MNGEIYQLINFVSFSRWFFIGLAALGMLIHRYRFPLHPRPFKVSCLPRIARVCTILVLLSTDRGLSRLSPEGAAGHSSHLHHGLLLPRGPLSVLGPLEHGGELRSHAERGARLLPDRAQLPLAPQMETHLQ